MISEKIQSFEEKNMPVLIIAYVIGLAISGFLAFFTEEVIRFVISLCISATISGIATFLTKVFLQSTWGIKKASDNTWRRKGRYQEKWIDNMYNREFIILLVLFTLSYEIIDDYLHINDLILEELPISIQVIGTISLIVFGLLVILGLVTFYNKFKETNN